METTKQKAASTQQTKSNNLAHCDSCIKLYRDELDRYAWRDYCEKFNVPYTAEIIIIYFNSKNCEYE